METDLVSPSPEAEIVIPETEPKEDETEENQDESLAVELSARTVPAPRSRPTGTVKLFVGNLNETITESDLRPLFEEFGSVSECAVLRSYGFVHMEDPEAAKLAIKALNGHILKGKSISVELSTGQSTKRQAGSNGDYYDWYQNPIKKPRPAPTKLFVGNLSETVTAEELRPLFEKFGHVVECDVLKSYGFVHMESSVEATEAIKQLNGYQINGRAISVERSTSTVRQKPGMGGGNMCFKCGGRGHWSKDCFRERVMPPVMPPTRPPMGPPPRWREPMPPPPPPPMHARRDIMFPPPIPPDNYMREKYVNLHYYNSFHLAVNQGPMQEPLPLSPYDRYDRYTRDYDRYFDYGKGNGYDRQMIPPPSRELNYPREDLYKRPPMNHTVHQMGFPMTGIRNERSDMMYRLSKEGHMDFTRDPMLPTNRSFGGVDRMAPVSYPAPLRRPL